MMIKKVLFAAVIASISGSCLANWVGDVSYMQIQDKSAHNSKDLKDEGISAKTFDYNAIAASVGYEVPINENFTITPEVQYGRGLGDDSQKAVQNVLGGDPIPVKLTSELKQFYGFNVRAQYNFNPQFYAYVQPQYTRIEREASMFNQASKIKDKGEWKDTKFGYGAGVGYMITPKLAADLGYIKINSLDNNILKLGMRYKF